MSMISGLIDELNKSADEWNGSNMFELARMCREAADTIWQLRDDLQRANAENDKLREELADAPKCETCEAMLDCDECLRADGSHRDRRRLSTENAKLRESVKRLMAQRDERLARAEADNSKLRRLVMDYNYCILHVDCAMCKYKYGGTMSEHCPLSPCFPDIDELHELRVEVE